MLACGLQENPLQTGQMHVRHVRYVTDELKVLCTLTRILSWTWEDFRTHKIHISQSFGDEQNLKREALS